MRSRGQIIAKDEEIPHQKYLVRVYIGRENGKRKYASALVAGTYKQAERKLTELLRGSDTATLVRSTKVTVQSHLESWLQTKKDISPGSKLAYSYRLEHDVYPSLGSTQLQKVTPKVIREFYSDLGKPKTEGGRGLKPRTIKLTHAVLDQGFAQAVADGLLMRNPCDDATSAIAKTRKSEAVSLTREEVAKVLDEAGRHPHGLYFQTLLKTGLRPGEGLALRWSDLTAAGLSVSRTVAINEAKQSYVKDCPKTDESIRVVPISVGLKGDLERHRKDQLKVMMQAGPEYDRTSDLIFAQPNGAHIPLKNMRELWKRIIKRAGVRDVRLYDTRHTHISWLLEDKQNPKVIATRTGHANPNVLLGAYAHVLPGAAEQLADTFETLLLAKVM